MLAQAFRAANDIPAIETLQPVLARPYKMTQRRLAYQPYLRR